MSRRVSTREASLSGLVHEFRQAYSRHEKTPHSVVLPKGCALVNESNAAVVQSAYEALSGGNGAAFLETLDENVIWHESTAGFAGTYRGRDEVADLFGRFMQEIEGLSVDLHDILATRDHAVVLHTTTWSRRGRTATLQYADVYHVGNGKITEHWHLAVDPRADDDFWR